MRFPVWAPIEERIQQATEIFWDEAIEGFDDRRADERICELADRYAINEDQWEAIHNNLQEQWKGVEERFPGYVKQVPGG